MKYLQWQNGNVHKWEDIDIHDVRVTYRSGSINITLVELRSPEEIKTKAIPNSLHAPQEDCL